MRKRKYEAKTEEWLQHASRYLYGKYWGGHDDGWYDEGAEHAVNIIKSLIKKVGDN